jgi:hypothetical protein
MTAPRRRLRPILGHSCCTQRGTRNLTIASGSVKPVPQLRCHSGIDFTVANPDWFGHVAQRTVNHQGQQRLEGQERQEGREGEK